MNIALSSEADPSQGSGYEAFTFLVSEFRRYGWSLSQQPTPDLVGCLDILQAEPIWDSPEGDLCLVSVGGSTADLVLDFFDIVRAAISVRDRTVRIIPGTADLCPQTLGHFVMDILLPRLIAEDGCLVLHGALIARGTDAICLVGESGRGKSTLSAALRNAGWTFHGDDALVLRAEGAGSDARITARASYPSLRLFPDSLDQLFPERPAGLAPVADYLDKFRLDPGDLGDPDGPCRLRAVLVLGEDDGEDRIVLQPLTVSRLCMTLVGQSFALDPVDPKAAHGRLSAASAVAARVPGVRLRYPRDYARLPEVIGRIDDFLDQLQADGPGIAPRPTPL